MIDKISLAREALRKASMIRRKVKIDRFASICIYDLVEKCGVEVKFQSINSMEGMYIKDEVPTILVTSERHAGRQAYTCAHEFGHHVFGHGSKIDENLDDKPCSNQTIGEEFLVDSFAGHLLMSRHAIIRAFSLRNWDISSCTPFQMHVIAGQLGVSYKAIINHMRLSLGLITKTCALQLSKHSRKSIRKSILGCNSTPRLLVVDSHWNSKVAIDLHVGEQAILPSGVSIENKVISLIKDHELGLLVEGRKPGIEKSWLTNSTWAANIRVSRKGYIGRSLFRHLEDPDDNQ